jgi:hypothetical protein
MKIHLVLIFLTGLFFLACGGDGGNQPTTKTLAENTPTETLKQYVEASRKKDIATMKRLLSRASLELIEKSAKEQNLTTDDILRKEASVEIKNAPETRNEKIEGETASVEIKNEKTGEFDMRLPFVREDGAWKIARDKYIQELMKKLTEDMNRPPSNLSFSNSNK